MAKAERKIEAAEPAPVAVPAVAEAKPVVHCNACRHWECQWKPMANVGQCRKAAKFGPMTVWTTDLTTCSHAEAV